MKKKVAVTSILGLIFLLGAVALFLFAGDIVGAISGGARVPYTFQGNFVTKFGGFFQTILEVVKCQFTNLSVMSYVNIGLTGVLLIVVVVQLVMLCQKRAGAALWEFFSALICVIAIFLFISISFVPGFAAVHGPFYSMGSYAVAANAWTGAWGWFVVLGTSNSITILELLILLAPALLLVVGFILMLVALISDMRYLASLPKKGQRKHDAPNEDEVFVIDDEQLESDKVAEAARENLNRNGGYQSDRRAEPMPVPAPAGIQGPLLVQYINTYSPGESQNVAKGNVPLSEIQSNITGEKPLTAEEIRKIIAEEIADKKEPAPVIVSVPAPEKAPEEPKLTAEDVRAIFSEELGRYLAQDENGYGENDDVVVEEEPAPAPALTAEDVRQIIADELASYAPAQDEIVVEQEPENVRDVVREELASFHAAQDQAARAKEEKLAAEKAREEELAAAKAEAAEAARKETEAKYQEQPKPLSSEEIRKIIAEEMAKAPAEEKKEEAAITADLIREIIRAELKDNAPVQEEKVAPVTVVIKQKEEVKAEPEPEPEPAPAPAPVVVPVVVAPAAPAPAPEKPKEPRVVGAVNPDLPPHDKIIRIPFPTRMVEGDKDLKSNYNELKSEIMSYGVKSRVSNSGDTFRLHKVTFVKITVAGKGLKLYFALDPKDYANTTLPVQDAGHKGTYSDIPLVFKVKSELSVRRAKQLIADVMEKNGIEQGKIEPHNWAKELKDYKPAGSNKDED